MVVGRFLEGVFFKNDWKEFLLKNERGEGT
jgi:hypothetical protein